jgi:hypothetical protein
MYLWHHWLLCLYSTPLSSGEQVDWMEHKGVYTSLLQLPKLVRLSALNNKILKYIQPRERERIKYNNSEERFP